MAIGVATVVAAVDKLRKPTTTFRRERCGRASGALSWPEALALDVALSLNNVGTGVGAGIAGISPLTTTALAGAVSLVCVGGGSRAGWSVGRLLVGRRAPLLAGLVLVGVGGAMLSGAG